MFAFRRSLLYKRHIPWINPYSFDQFVVTSKNGFLPAQDPLPKLPSAYAELENLLQRMPFQQSTSSPGLLWTGALGAAVQKELPEYNLDGIKDLHLLSALYRDYCFLASAYLLEPCDLEFRRSNGQTYGLGRKILPRNIAVPLTKASESIGAKPFMEYALSYALFNYKRLDPQLPPDLPNLDLIRSFTNTEDEKGFILIHVAMVRYSGDLVKHTENALWASSVQDRDAFAVAMDSLAQTLQKVVQTLNGMWVKSDSSKYLSFRTFIMGSKNQPMFPDGVVYEGVSSEPLFFRGETGANDSMIPTMDNLLGLKMPQNPLTNILKDFRSYRPRNHRHWLEWVLNQSKDVDLRGFGESYPEGKLLLLKVLDQVRDFRDLHWRLTKEYILKRTRHPVATGGSPIVTWLPNQLDCVMVEMERICEDLSTSTLSNNAEFLDIQRKVKAQRRILHRDVKHISEAFGNRAAVEAEPTPPIVEPSFA